MSFCYCCWCFVSVVVVLLFVEFFPETFINMLNRRLVCWRNIKLNRLSRASRLENQFWKIENHSWSSAVAQKSLELQLFLRSNFFWLQSWSKKCEKLKNQFLCNINKIYDFYFFLRKAIINHFWAGVFQLTSQVICLVGYTVKPELMTTCP